MFFYTINSFTQINEGQLNEAFSNLGDSMTIEAFNFDINKIKKFNFQADTILWDTTLNISKLYEFNYRRKDNFEFIKPNNVGQVYNNLSYEIEQSNYPSIGFNANKSIIQFEDDIYFYDVAYPVTELLFKTVYSQGQLTDALFTTNVNRKLNFSLSFKALRSLGKYQNSLSGSKNFNFTYNYNSEKFNSKMFYVSQRLEKHENGGLTTISIDDFESKDDVFDERSKLNVKFEDAINIYFIRNFFSKNSFNLTNNKKKISFNHTLLYSTINNTYDQKTINNYYGELNSGLISAKDNYKFRSIFNKISLNLSNLIFDSIEAGLINFNFEYFNLNNNENKIRENSNLFSLKLTKGFEVLDQLSLDPAQGDTRAIYDLSPAAASQHIRARWQNIEADAYLITGTGLPTLRIIAELSETLPGPVLSSNLCLAWATQQVAQIAPAELAPTTRMPLLAGWEGCLERLWCHCGCNSQAASRWVSSAVNGLT